MTTVIVTEPLVIGAGESPSFHNEQAYRIEAQTFGDPANGVDNFGDITVTWDDGFGHGAVDAHPNALDAYFHNHAGASLTIVRTGNPAPTGAFALQDPSQLVTNDGEITLTSNHSAHFIAGALDNTGRIEVNAVDDAAGGEFQRVAIVNSGEIEITAQLGMALGFQSSGDSSFDNSGLLSVHGGSGAWGLAFNGEDYSFDNSGSIIVEADAAKSIGVYIGPDEDFDPVFTNSGTIRAKQAFYQDTYNKILNEVTIQNTGRIIGDIVLDYGRDTVVNDGRIMGEVRLGAGDDTFQGGGLIRGNVQGGRGNDLLQGGGLSEVLYGDSKKWQATDRADNIDGGGGHDILQGGGGADLLAGGADSDTFWYRSVNESAVGAEDLILDLAGEDVINLSSIDANASLRGDQSFVLVDDFNGTAGQAVLRYEVGPDLTWLELDVDGDAVADAAIGLAGDQTDFTSFVL